VLEAAGPTTPRWRAAANTVVFEVEPAHAPALERGLHAALLENPQ
jgi:hypothetical protein